MSEPAGFGVVTIDTMKGMSGLAFLQAMRDGRLPRPPMGALLGFAIVEVAHGSVVFEGTPGQQHYNPLGSVHGGYAATLLDSCMGCAVQTTLAQGSGYTTLEFKVNFLKGITERTGPVRAEGRILSSGRRVATADSRLTDAQGRLLATGTTTCLVMEL
jgi:uncharacterized protein (TIGR00369 family)